MSCFGRYHSNLIKENLPLANLRIVCTGAGWIITTEGSKEQREGPEREKQ